MNFQLPLSTFFISFFVVLGLETRTLNILDKCHPTESQPKTPRVFYMKVLGHFYMRADTKQYYSTQTVREDMKEEEHSIVLCKITTP